MILAVEHFRDGCERRLCLVRLCRCGRSRGTSLGTEVRVIGRSLPDGASLPRRNERQISRKQRAVGAVPAVKPRAALRLRGRTGGRAVHSPNGLRPDSHRAERFIAARIVERDVTLLPDGIKGRLGIVFRLIAGLQQAAEAHLGLIIKLLNIICAHRPAHEVISLAGIGAVIQREDLSVLEDLIIHLPYTTVGFIMQRVAVRTEAGHIACAHIAVVLPLRDKRFAIPYLFLCKVIIPACKHAAVIHRGCRADNLTRFRINLFIDDLALHGKVILHRCFALRIERNTAERIGVGCVGDRHVRQPLPLGIEHHFLIVFNRLGKRCAVAVKDAAAITLSCPTVKGIPLALKLICVQIT